MRTEKQLEILGNTAISFSEKLKQSRQYPIKTTSIDILQMNISRKCNLACKHCHVEAGPDREEMMSREIFSKCLDILKVSTISTLDITGGAPEMNPHLDWFINKASKPDIRLIVRTNLVILKEEKYQKFIDIYTNNRVEICASLPHFSKEQSDRQRGCGSFAGAIEIIKQLNEKGYGIEGSGLVLGLVHNPVGAYLPGNQEALEHEYKTRLYEAYGIQFNTLFCITNMPLGRYLEYLLRTDNFDDYMVELANAYNTTATENVMCKNTLSVSWDGTLYNCDFNQMLCLPAKIGQKDNIMDFSPGDFKDRDIVVHNHCFGCAAGSGSSCQGATGS
jgi:radical SAM/Cys-rich protein